MEYDFNQLDNAKFQRLINGILVARFGEDVRLTPLRGADGGRDAETAPGNPYYEVQIGPVTPPSKGIYAPPRSGRYLFQAKQHLTIDARLSDVRRTVIADFEDELQKNVLTRTGDQSVNYFFLITNVPSSREALEKLDEKRAKLLEGIKNLHADIWWKEQLTTFLDHLPSLWNSYPEIFAGRKVPFLAEIAGNAKGRISRAVQLAIHHQYQRDSSVKFRQIDLERDLSKLFVDLDVDVRHLSEKELLRLASMKYRGRVGYGSSQSEDEVMHEHLAHRLMFSPGRSLISALQVLLNGDKQSLNKIILEGGPGQGKSTITQMMVQIYRQQILPDIELDPEKRWDPPQKSRLPFRMELRNFGEWLAKNQESSVEEYLASVIKHDAGGSDVSVNDIHDIVEENAVLLIFDGLDEVASDELRSEVITKIVECVKRFEKIKADLLVVVTTRPPAITGYRDRLINFRPLSIAPMNEERIDQYVDRWLEVQLQEESDRDWVRNSFEKRRHEAHVDALIKNPMQLSVLLHFIRLKGEAFPSRRAELYRDYFQVVIDRDVQKYPELIHYREIIEALHQFLGYKIHALTEVEQADRTLSRQQLLTIVENWLEEQGNEAEMAHQLFKLGEERLGLIVALKGEGEAVRYGYEVQPIQEYFAAAFISDQIPADNAHNAFEAMIRRSYWKEVALFLAGLRRPNEKADLIVRAKHLDKDNKLGWRQDGRALILQLIQEGVFSQPRVVFSEALNFVMDLLEPDKIPVQNEPGGLLRALPRLIEQAGTKEHLDRLSKLLKTNKSCQDESIVYRIYSVASKVLEPDEVRKELLSHQFNSPSLIAKSRVVWSSSWNIDMSEEAQTSSFWEGASDDIWVYWLWHTGLRGDLASGFPVPPRFHLYLIEQFSSNPMPMVARRYWRHPVIEPVSNWAVWKLVTYQQLLTHISILQTDTELETQKEMLELSRDDDHTEFSGLDQEIQIVVADLLKISREALRGMLEFGRENDPLNSLGPHIPTILKYLEKPGLIGWFACRFATNLLGTILTHSIEHRREFMLGYRTVDQSIGQYSEWQLLLTNLKQYYGIKKEAETFDLLVAGLVRPHTQEIIPKYVRLEEKGDYVDIVNLLAEKICHKSRLPFDWLERIPFTTAIIRPLVDKCGKDCFLELLLALGEMNFIQVSRSSMPLLTPDMQRILKLARDTENSRLIRGALIAISTSKFIRSAKTDLLLKLIQNEVDSLQFVRTLFSTYRFDGPDVDIEEVKIVDDVAGRILESPEDYSFHAVSAAARYLAERVPVNLPSLLNEEHRLLAISGSQS